MENIKKDFIKWLKEKHGEVVKETDIQVTEIIDREYDSIIPTIILTNKEGKAYFDIVGNGFEFQGFKEW